MVGMATIATVIASQAVITGAFSLTQQAIQLGLVPRMEIRWTSETREGADLSAQGQLSCCSSSCCCWSSMFKSSSALAHAYGIAVTGTMVVTAIMAFFVVWRCWRLAALGLAARSSRPSSLVDVVFLAANALKIPQGGWMPLLVGGALVGLMLTWRRGTRILFDKTRKTDVPLLELIGMLEKSQPHRVKGTAVFMTSDPEIAPGGAPAQSQAQQGPARTERGPDGPDRGCAARRDDERVRSRHLGGLFLASRL